MPDDVTLPTNGTAPTAPRQRLRAIDQIREAYKRTRHRMEIAAWADDAGAPMELFFTAISPADVAALNARMDAMHGTTNEDRHIALLIMKAQDDQGRALFTMGDAPALKTESTWGTLIDVINSMYSLGSTPTLEAAKELLTTDQALAFRVKLADQSGRSVEEVESWSLRDLTLLAAYHLLMAERQQAAEAERP